MTRIWIVKDMERDEFYGVFVSQSQVEAHTKMDDLNHGLRKPRYCVVETEAGDLDPV